MCYGRTCALPGVVQCAGILLEPSLKLPASSGASSSRVGSAILSLQ